MHSRTNIDTSKSVATIQLNQPVNWEEIVAMVIGFISASYETTVNALSFTAYLLALNPIVQDRLVRDINEYYDINPV